MENFTYYAPTKVVFGKDTEQQTGALAKEFGATKVLVVYGGGSVVKNGLLERVLASLEEAGLAHATLGGVVPNPRIELAREGIALCAAEGIDFVLGVGGGSVIDTAKAIAYGAKYDGDVWDIYEGKAPIAAALPVGAVVTLAAAGSEMSNSSVMTNEAMGIKRGSNSDYGRCKFAVMNPELTVTLPAYQTACGCADILMHTLERYFTAEEPMELTQSMAEALLRTVMGAGRTLTRRPKSYAARAELMWAGALSHNGLTGCGAGLGDWAPHQMTHEIGGMFDIAHGAALTAIWGSWARYVMDEDPARFAKLGLDVLELEDEGSDEELAAAAIEEMESFFWALELPTSLTDAGIEATDEQILAMAKSCSRGGTRTIGSFKKLDEADMVKIFTMAR